MKIEEMFQKLDEILDGMEQGLTLEETFSQYEQGMKLLEQCSKQIADIEQKVVVLQQGQKEAVQGDGSDE